MNGKNKKILCIAVLFLLSVFFLVAVIFLQLRSCELQKEITARKEMHAIEETKACKDHTKQEDSTEITTSQILEIQREEPKQTVSYASKPTTPKVTQSKPPIKHEETETKVIPATTAVQEILTEAKPTEAPSEPELAPVLSVNLKTKKIHGPNCPVLNHSNPESVKQILRKDVEEYLWEGYSFCSKCKGYAQDER